ncbi:hypothetical protein OSB04_007299 [Centaurea solstitialis]|uniref:F-box domain-containing protein n=1 Tax=Centaurea solstitialis TaxID=347529 RepID=A0AA38TJN5_9ASTR|nr:hypothetical protein OSB04_007299 [Centaurea solstitialis]
MAYNNDDKRRKAVCGIVAEPTTKQTKIHESMENTNIPDEVLDNILSRLSPKPLMRFRCASKHWNRLITDLNSRSRRMILLCYGRTHLYAFDPKHQNTVKLTYPFEHQIYKFSIIGTLLGIVLLLLEENIVGPRIFILYNPLTRATKKLPGLPRPCCVTAAIGSIYGFSHGNIVTAQGFCFCPSSNNRCYNRKVFSFDVFSLKNGSWTTRKAAGGYQFVDKVGMSLNGFLHWIVLWPCDDKFKIMVLDVMKMVVTHMDGPCLTKQWYNPPSSVLGTLHGRLCMSIIWRNGFDVWVKEQSKWSKQYSIELPLYRYGRENDRDVCILEEGKILVKCGGSNQIIMCHVSEGYYEVFKCASEIRLANNYKGKPFEYVESLFSPSDICNV